jgi:hypothetical protein
MLLDTLPLDIKLGTGLTKRMWGVLNWLVFSES